MLVDGPLYAVSALEQSNSDLRIESQAEKHCLLHDFVDLEDPTWPVPREKTGAYSRWLNLSL
jgi:hypothetical protein